MFSELKIHRELSERFFVRGYADLGTLLNALGMNKRWRYIIGKAGNGHAFAYTFKQPDIGVVEIEGKASDKDGNMRLCVALSILDALGVEMEELLED